MIQRGRPTNKVQRKHAREVFHAEHAPPAMPKYLNWSEHSIGFDRSDHPPKIPCPGHHALVLEAQIGGFTSKKVFMDGGSSLNLIYADTLQKIKILMDNLLPTETSFHGIVPGKPMYPLGAIHLDVIFGTPSNFRKKKIEFEVVDWPLQYHAILGRPAFARFMAVPHYAYLKLRMPTNKGPLTISGSFARSENCDKDFNSMSQIFGVHEELNHIRESPNMDVDPLAQQNAPELSFDASKDTREHQIHPMDPTKTARVSNSLSPARVSNQDELKIFPNAKPIKQSMRRYNPEKAWAMGKEINCLLEAKFIREIKEAAWLTPPVMVEKKDTKIYRMCIDFTALNKHCPKDYFPLPQIDQIIDFTAGCECLSFLDAYSGYNQIRLKVEDEDKTVFITPHGVYCYMMMPFRHQRCMQACLKEQISRNIEVYIDDIVIKSSKADSLLEDLRETFANLDRYSIKLNPKKCSFRVPTG
jgi:hypothetical protein